MSGYRQDRRVIVRPVRDVVVPGTRFAAADVPSIVSTTLRRRVLDRVSIRAQLAGLPRLDEDLFVDIVDDESGSMWGGNDALGLRNEAALIALEHIAGGRRKRRGVHTYGRFTTFDLRSPMELSLTELDGRGLRDAENALLARAPGGSSNLGPALATVERDRPTARRVLTVMSDFELFDPDRRGVLRALVDSEADEVLALVFRSGAPPELDSTRVRVEQIDPTTSQPADVARHIVDAVIRASSRPDEEAAS